MHASIVRVHLDAKVHKPSSHQSGGDLVTGPRKVTIQRRYAAQAYDEAHPADVSLGSTLTGRQGSPGKDVRIELPHAFLDTLLGRS